MEWVETVAKTVDEAKSAALDQLGVAEDEAEIEVIATPKPGLFGRVRGEARVRARVRPASVRPKVERRRRPGKNRQDEGGAGSSGPNKSSKESADDASDEGSERSSGRRRGKKGGRGSGGPQVHDASASVNGDSSNSAEGQRRDAAGNSAGAKHEDGQGSATAGGRSPRTSQPRRKEPNMSTQGSSTDRHNGEPSPVTPDEVGAAAVSFLEGLAAAMGASATGSAIVDGTEIEVQLSGDDLGLLVGPAGGTLQAVQDLTRVVAQRKLGDHETRLRVDIAQYRERRRAALEKFAHAVSDQVIESQRPRALEPMSSADRKIIHDAVQTIDGVVSTSDGSEPNRRVVISPAD